MTVPEMCAGCGYLMNNATSMSRPLDAAAAAVPSDGDLSLCLNCGLPYQMHHGTWRRLTLAALLALPAPMHRAMRALERRRRHAVRTDLAQRSGRA